MCNAPGMAPCSYSSGSRTSSTTAAGCARSSSAVAVSTSRIACLVCWSNSRKLATAWLLVGTSPKAYSGSQHSRWAEDSLRCETAPVTSKALELLRASESNNDEGYVSLQSAPYRGHHL